MIFPSVHVEKYHTDLEAISINKNDNEEGANDTVVRNYENDAEYDVIAQWFHLGFHHVLEKIFLNLTPESKAACLKVSKTWKQIVDYFYKSANPRYQVQCLIICFSICPPSGLLPVLCFNGLLWSK